MFGKKKELWVGDEIGEINIFGLDTFKEWKDIKFTEYCYCDKYAFFRNSDDITVYIDKTDIDGQEILHTYIKRFRLMNINTIIVDLSDDDGMRELLYGYTLWRRLPIILFRGYFISAGRTLLHMFETGTINRICESL